ncbi:hypothetical protein BpHYR1_024305 [Brachionus plicatilis]|uniref:Uncharacterized protein n=1 Tax=Brachionus plicatilis TaxID=10195 RepID=A0A3M7SDS1_BRAPC|nr:hypothetical protein BpHYR1_024305 [Brachionus plicatilis]
MDLSINIAHKRGLKQPKCNTNLTPCYLFSHTIIKKINGLINSMKNFKFNFAKASSANSGHKINDKKKKLNTNKDLRFLIILIQKNINLKKLYATRKVLVSNCQAEQLNKWSNVCQITKLTQPNPTVNCNDHDKNGHGHCLINNQHPLFVQEPLVLNL